MFLFKKPEYKYIELGFILDDFSIQESDSERITIDIEAYGEIDGKMRYCYSGFTLKDPKMYENGDFESMLDLLRNPDNKTVLIELKYKNGNLKDFRLKTESLAKAYNDERFLQLDLIGWGLNDISCKDMNNSKSAAR
ncbi:MAG: hypothetical protein ACI4KO_02285 [Ruminiclostridium sp.]